MDWFYDHDHDDDGDDDKMACKYIVAALDTLMGESM